MRLWSIHPDQLDRIALVAVWREGLLAKKVLEGNTKGYKNHPQLDRFKVAKDPIATINFYLHNIVDEAELRGYSFDRSKLIARRTVPSIALTNGQLAYEWDHLSKKSAIRSTEHYEHMLKTSPKPHPLFVLVDGPIADWERG